MLLETESRSRIRTWAMTCHDVTSLGILPLRQTRHKINISDASWCLLCVFAHQRTSSIVCCDCYVIDVRVGVGIGIRVRVRVKVRVGVGVRVGVKYGVRVR